MNNDNNYAQCVDHLVSTMPSQSDPPFDTQSYANYKAQVDKERELISSDNITESLYRLGYKIDTLLTKIISQLDKIIAEDKPT